MDELDLEKLKRELDDVSGGSQYDVDDILREAGADTPEVGGEELDQLMQKFGITVEAEQTSETVKLDDAQAEAPSGVHLAAQQTEQLVAQQDEMAQQTAESDPLAEQDALFAQLFTQLDEIEQHPIDDLLEPPTQAMPAEQQTQILHTAAQPDEPEQDEPEQPETADSEPDEPQETADEPDEIDETGEAAGEPPKKGFFARLFGFDEDDEADDIDEADEDEETDEPDEETDEEQPSDEPEKQPGEPIDGEPDAPEQAEQLSDEPAQQSVESDDEAPKRSFFARLFGFDEDEEADEDEEIDETDESDEETDEEQPSDEPEEQIEAQPDEPEEAPDEPEQTDEPEQDEPSAETEDAGVAAFADALAQEAAVGATEETPEPPHPRPEDTPVISEAELEEFLTSVKEEEQQPRASFEQLLRDNGIDVEQERKPKKQTLPEEFPDEETTVYVDVPVRERTEQPDEARQPELFDIEAEQPEPEEPPMPLDDPDWLGLPLEQVCQIAPPLEELRVEGPVMARELARQKDWLMGRIRAYQQEQQAQQEQQPAQADDSETPIHAAEELQAMKEQESEQERDSVFPDGSADKPETEAADRENAQTTEQQTQQVILTLPVRQAHEQEPAQTDEPQTEQKPQPPRKPQPRKSAAKKPARRTAGKRRETWPKEDAPHDVRRAEKHWRMRTQRQAKRSIGVLICALLAVYLSCADDFSLLPLPDSLNYVANPLTALQVLVVLQLAAMVFAYDVIWEGIQAAIHRTPNFSTLVDLALVLNLIHCAVRMASQGEEIPFACMALLALFAQLRVRCSFSATRSYAYKTALNAHQPMGLFYHGGKRPHLVKAPLTDVHDFVEQLVQPDENWKQERVLTVFSVVCAAVLSVIVCTATGDIGRIWYVLAATVTGACQLSLLSAAPMAHKHAARFMAKNGSAVVGRRGAHALASADTVVLTDNDLFPAGTIALQQLELRSSLNDSTALAYAAALAGDSSLGHMLAEEVRTRYGAQMAAHHVVQYADGGIGGQIGGLEVLLGDQAFMAQHGMIVRDVPENGLVLALDRDVAAILVIDYIVPAAQYTAMHALTERHLTILLHTRNQQVTPELVERLYGLKKGTVIVPELEQDRAMQDARYTEGDALCGLLVRDGMLPLSGCVSTAQEQTQLTRIGGVIGVCAAIICMLLMTYLCYVFVPADARPIRMLIYGILWFIPIFFLSNGVGRD